MTKTKLSAKADWMTELDIKDEIAELRTLLRVVGEEAIMMRNAGKLAQKEKTYFGDIVTEADHLVEREIMKRIQSRYPAHCVNGEEGGPSKPQGSTCEYEWIVNPIDGTTNFSKGLKFFSIAIGLMHLGTPVLGVLYFPELSRFIYAIKGRGVFDNGKPLAVFDRPSVKDMRQGLLAVATTSRKEGRIPIFGALRMESMNLINTGCMTYNCLLLAERKLDAVVHTDATIFSLAAVIPILEEAGCVVSGFEEEHPDLGKKRIPVILAENKELLHDSKKRIQPHWEQAEK